VGQHPGFIFIFEKHDVLCENCSRFPEVVLSNLIVQAGIFMLGVFFKHTPHSDFQSVSDHLFDNLYFPALISLCTVLPSSKIQTSPSDWPEAL